jgi:hypothetical protein
MEDGSRQDDVEQAVMPILVDVDALDLDVSRCWLLSSLIIRKWVVSAGRRVDSSFAGRGMSLPPSRAGSGEGVLDSP